ncbi:MAG: DUF302 domain-containing protein [Chthoniobacterales bacterium]|nr:DUF302 domain-containing protein [Chthoniobacterales bacterium]
MNNQQTSPNPDSPVFSRTTSTPADATAARLMEVAKENGFGTLHSYDLKQILTSKGFPQTKACHVLEVCNPAQASKVLAADYGMNIMLPCRISVYEDDGKTVIAMARPASLIGLFAPKAELQAVAREVESTMVKIIEDTAGGS